MDKHYPVWFKVFIKWPLIPWYNTDIAETKWSANNNIVRQSWLFIRIWISRPDWSLTASSKLLYYDENILGKCVQSRKLFAILNKMCHWKQTALPDIQPAQLVASLKDYFVKKITLICKDIEEQALQLQWAQNMSAIIITGIKKHDR